MGDIFRGTHRKRADRKRLCPRNQMLTRRPNGRTELHRKKMLLFVFRHGFEKPNPTHVHTAPALKNTTRKPFPPIALGIERTALNNNRHINSMCRNSWNGVRIVRIHRYAILSRLRVRSEKPNKRN